MGKQFTFADYQKSKHPYQADGELLLLEQKHACLWYEPGKGKTYPAIAALLQAAPYGKVLILSTADSIKNMWETDIATQGVLPRNTLMLSFTSIIQEATKAKLLKINWDVIIVDECHKVKSHNSQTSKLVFQLTKKCKYVWGLTGTPRGNSDLDVFCQFHNLNISDWGLVSYTNFVQTCCDVEQSWGRAGGFSRVIGINHRYIAGWERNIAMYTQRVCYEDGDMPPLNIVPEILSYTPTEEYKLAESGIFVIDDNATTIAKLAAIAKMHQAANGFFYHFDEDDVKHTHRFQVNKKIAWLKDNVKGDGITIVYRHTADFEDLEKAFPNSTENISDFKAGKFPILLLQCSRCESFNLQMCSEMYFYTMDYSYIKFKQMLHRIWRTGQEQDTLVKILIFENTIEEVIWKSVSTKKRLADIFMAAKGGSK